MKKTINEILECEFRDDQEKLCWALVDKIQKIMINRISLTHKITETDLQTLGKEIK